MKKYLIKLAKFLRTFGLLSWSSLILLVGLVGLTVITYILIFQTVSLNFCQLIIQTKGNPIQTVSSQFLSLGLDSTVITDRFKHFNMTDPKLIKMIKYLSPAYLRIGGNQADQILFCNNENGENCSSKYENAIFNESSTFTLSGSDWLKLYKLAQSANMDVIYDLNSLLRYENNSWNSKNAEEMIQFSQDNGLVLNWELGNEPNSYEHKFNTSVSPAQLGSDYILLRNILNRYKLYNNSYLVGPSTTRLRTEEIEEYFTEFLITGSQAVNAVTWHHYYFSGMNATPSEFLNPYVFDYLEDCIDTVTHIVNNILELSKTIWLGETSSAWHSGAPGLSDRFIAGFIWIDKLGLSAQKGINVVIRQSIFKGHYALLNDSYYPNPDWWLSIIYKKLVGTAVIGASTSGNEKIRLYAHCAKNSILGDSYGRSVIVFGVNLQDKVGFVKIDDGFASSRYVYVYEITSESTLYSQYIRLNGQTLNLLPNLTLPEMKPKIIVRTKVLTMPAYSIVFWIFTTTNVEACGSIEL